jgi:hypothetical protein
MLRLGAYFGNKHVAAAALNSAVIAIFAEYSTPPEHSTIIFPIECASDAAAFAGDGDATS